MEPVEWLDLGGGQTEIRAVGGDFFDQWIVIPVEIQADNAASMNRPAERRDTEDGEGRVGGIAGLPDTWMCELGEGVLVGTSNTGLAYYVTPEGVLTRVGGGAVMDGDVVD